MGKPVTPLVGCDVAVIDRDRRILLVRRTDNNLWAIPGGCQDLTETPKECAEREFQEETGYTVQVSRLLGTYSSRRYEYVHYPWKDNVFTHLLFSGEIVGGEAKSSEETSEISWFAESDLPALSDGHAPRVAFAFACFDDRELPPFFE